MVLVPCDMFYYYTYLLNLSEKYYDLSSHIKHVLTVYSFYPAKIKTSFIWKDDVLFFAKISILCKRSENALDGQLASAAESIELFMV